jgi:hypothetical protein
MAKLMVLTIAGLAAAGALGQPSAQESDAQRQQRIATILRNLEREPDQSYIVPRDLAQLVSLAQAAVVGRIVSFGDLSTLDDVGRQSQVMATDVFASYGVLISEVLYNRVADGPPLEPEVPSTITQWVDKRAAELFVSRSFPPLDGREYLLFLWLRPGAGSWSMLQWPLQFRRSGTAPEEAESAAALPYGGRLLKPEWLDSSVPLIATGRDAVAPDWEGLVGEVKRLSVVVRPLLGQAP